jgi:hypothetical protein
MHKVEFFPAQNGGKTQGIAGNDDFLYPVVYGVFGFFVMEKREVDFIAGTRLVLIQYPCHDFVQLMTGTGTPVIELLGENRDSRGRRRIHLFVII